MKCINISVFMFVEMIDKPDNHTYSARCAPVSAEERIRPWASLPHRAPKRKILDTGDKPC